MKREFLMLAHQKKDANVLGWYASEKLDGMRAFWDGGVSRGVPKSHVPWSNTSKDGRYREVQIATGLWSRYGNVIHAPDWFLDNMPGIPVDGELFKRGKRQELMSIVKKTIPGDEWRDVEYHCFGLVPPEVVFRTGTVNKRNVVLEECLSFMEKLDYIPKRETMFQDQILLMGRFLDKNDSFSVLPQEIVSDEDHLLQLLEAVTSAGGEGLILRNPHSLWLPSRSHNLLKMKPLNDAEGTVIGYTTGKKTDKGSKLLGLMGALVVSFNGNEVHLSGFTDAERTLIGGGSWAEEHPGERCPDGISAKHFPLGKTVTFKYRELTKDGFPEEARFWRHHIKE